MEKSNSLILQLEATNVKQTSQQKKQINKKTLIV